MLRLSSSDYDAKLSYWGGLIENFVVAELQKQISWSHSKYKLYFYRDHVGNEIDILIEEPRKELVAIEIKANETIKADFFKTIRRFSKDYGKRLKRGIILYRGDTVLSFGDDLIALPLQSIWEL